MITLKLKTIIQKLMVITYYFTGKARRMNVLNKIPSNIQIRMENSFQSED